MTCSGQASCGGGGAPNISRSVSGGRTMDAGGAGALGNALAKLPLMFSCLRHRLLDCRAVMVICFHVFVQCCSFSEEVGRGTITSIMSAARANL